jgi:hypothetical protein
MFIALTNVFTSVRDMVVRKENILNMLYTGGIESRAGVGMTLNSLNR